MSKWEQAVWLRVEARIAEEIEEQNKQNSEVLQLPFGTSAGSLNTMSFPTGKSSSAMSISGLALMTSTSPLQIPRTVRR